MAVIWFESGGDWTSIPIMGLLIYFNQMFINSLVELLTISMFLVGVSSARPQQQDTVFEIGESIIGLVLMVICIVIYLKDKPKVKYVEFQSFEVEEKGKGAISSEVKLGLHNEMADSHKTISEKKEPQTSHSTSIEKKKRRRKVDRLQGLTKKESESDMQGEKGQQYRDDCIEVE